MNLHDLGHQQITNLFALRDKHKNSGSIPILLEDCVNEYELPHKNGMLYAHMITHWDWYRNHELLIWEHKPSPGNDIEDIAKQTFQNMIEALPADIEMLWELNEHQYNNYNIIYISFDQSTPDWKFSEFLKNMINGLLSLWGHRGADDDYYDYLPSVTDQFRQLCTIFGAKTYWEYFLKILVNMEGDEVLEESLYSTDIPPYQVKP